MIWKLKHLWRRLRGRCDFCGEKREQHTLCDHCKYPRLCHHCGKLINWGKAYGMNRAKLMGVIHAL